MSKKKSSFFLRAAAAVAITLAPSLVAHSLDTEEKMQIVEMYMTNKGYENNGFRRYKYMRDGSSERYVMYTTPGEHYAVIAICDDDCRDLDLSVRDIDSDVAVDIDYEKDEYPIVEFVARKSKYVVKVDLEDCTTPSCFVRVSAFREL